MTHTAHSLILTAFSLIAHGIAYGLCAFGALTAVIAIVRALRPLYVKLAWIKWDILSK